MATLNRQIATSADDANRRKASYPSYFDTTSTLDWAGAEAGGYYGYGCGLRFTNITIPQGATITTAYLTFVAKFSKLLGLKYL